MHYCLLVPGLLLQAPIPPLKEEQGLAGCASRAGWELRRCEEYLGPGPGSGDVGYTVLALKQFN